MENILAAINDWMSAANGILWHDSVLYIVLGTGVLFTIWSGFSQYRAMTHGVNVLRGRYDDKNDPGAINHFQALSAALSATVGLGNIAGVAVAVSLGGPGAIFWMWVVGFFGMALKLTEVTQAMLFRNTSDPQNPHGGPMWVVSQGLARFHPSLAGLGKFIGFIFCVTLITSAITGGNMFQAWNVGISFKDSFGVPPILSGIVLALLVGAVIIGGIKRIGSVAGRLVPFMCGLYILAGLYVLALHFWEIPAMLKLIVSSAFNPTEAGGAFLGGTVSSAFLWGMKRALFSNEAGQGSAPIAHSAAKTDEPAREGVVAGLEPFIDTLCVCTVTALIILSTGAWNRGGEAAFSDLPNFNQNESGWVLESSALPAKFPEAEKIAKAWKAGDGIFMTAHFGNPKERIRITGEVVETSPGVLIAQWRSVSSSVVPILEDHSIYADYIGAALTSHAFDRAWPGLGSLLIPLAALLFALSTMISWSYYGEQGVIFMFGGRGVFLYKVIYCLLVIVACSGLITTEDELDNLSGLGTGVMLFANIPIMLLFGKQAMTAYKDYIHRLKSGEIKPSNDPRLVDVIEGRDIE
jgi:AGCS family alanine or glycine:cation symporter